MKQKHRRPPLSSLGAFLLAGLTVGLGFLGDAPAAQARLVEKIAAVVGPDIILASEVEEQAAPLLADLANQVRDPSLREVRAEGLRREVLDRLIDEQLLLQQASELKIKVTSEEVDRSIEEVKRQNNLSDDELAQALRAQKMTMATYREDLKKQILRFHVLRAAVGAKIAVSDDDVRNYYNRHLKSGNNIQVRAAHIFFVLPDDASAATVRELRERSDKLLVRARNGEDFADLAREHSEDPATRADGGDLGYFGRDMLPKPIEELVFAMEPGQVEGPVRTDRGFHIIKLLDRRTEDAKPFDDVKEELRAQLRAREMERQTRNYLTDLRRKTLIDVRL